MSSVDRRARLTWISAVLLLLSVALWEASYLCIRWRVGDYRARLEEGCFELAYLPLGTAGCPTECDWHHEDLPDGWVLYGFFGWETVWLPSISSRSTLKTAVIPLWIPSLFFSGLPVYSICLRLQRAARKRSGRCLTCGYDLQGSSERCPKCAQPFTRETRQADATA